MSLENFMRIADAFHVPLSFLLYDQICEMPEAERVISLLKDKNDKQKEYLLHMLQEMAAGMDKLL